MKYADGAGAQCSLAESDAGGVYTSGAQIGAVAASRCERCSGLLYWTELREWDGSRGQDSHGALQCILCGNVIDPVIVKNRQRTVASLRQSARSPSRRWRRILSESLSGAHGVERD
jgi:hypothetical protein